MCNIANPLVLTLLGVLLEAVLHAPCLGEEPDWPERYRYRAFLYDSSALENDFQLENTKQLLKSAVDVGYNCCILGVSTNLIQPKAAGDKFLRQLRLLRDEASRLGISLVVGVFPFDADYLVSPITPHLAEGLPVRDVACVVTEGVARLVPDPQVDLANTEFETVGQKGVPGWLVLDAPPDLGVQVDTGQAKYGNSSLRFKAFGKKAGAVGYQAIQRVRLPPFRLFRFGVWIRAKEHVEGVRARLVVRAHGRYLGNQYCDLSEPGKWSRHELLFNSLQGGETEVWLSVIGAESRAHEIWFDNVEFGHAGLVNVVRRSDCPVVVRNERGRMYQEKQDYEVVEDALFRSVTVEGSNVGIPLLSLTKRSRIRDGERLRVSFYSRTCCSLASLCTTSAHTYEFFEAGVLLLRKELAPFGYHLATKYLTTANWDETCQRSKGTLGAQWGDSLRRQISILSSGRSRPVCFVWSDMYEPWYDPYDKYWLRNGSLEDAWQHLPKDVIVLNARYNIGESKSPRFFAANGYLQVIAGDAKVGEWMRANADISSVVGVMNVEAPLVDFAEKAWGRLPQEIRSKLPPAPTTPGTRLKAGSHASAAESPSLATESEIRIWTDASGQHTVEASLIGVKSSVVTVRRRDGTELQVPLEKLSKEDRRWVLREAAKRNVAD